MWRYEISDGGAKMDIYDHTGSAVKRIENDGSGFTTADVLQAMEDEVMAEGLSGGLSERQIVILRDAVFEHIEEGTPP